jgi:SpoVK/Ycf46/Vps4 family AAA+-type ATPase
MNNQWVQSSNNFFIREVSQNVEKLAPSVYKLEEDPRSGEIYLTQVMDKYEFPYKIYGIETKFIERVKTTYDNTNGNLGILLNGVKGTGKTVTAKQICNNLNLPVILVHTAYKGIPNFINDIQQDVIIFVDEFEKIYSDRDHSVLSIMDGAMDNGFRKVFLLTTNELYINENMIQRPGRVRYLKTYRDLSVDVINEIVDDKLKYTELRAAVIEFISQLETITVDIVKAIIDEVNIHNEDPMLFKDIFNIKLSDPKANIYELIPGVAEPKLIKAGARISPAKFTRDLIGKGAELYVNGVGYLGNIDDVNEKDNTVDVSRWEDDDLDNEVRVTKRYLIEEIKSYHYHYAF